MAAKSNDGGIWELIRTVIYAVMIAIMIRTLFFEPFSIPSRSMVPTLLVGDYLFVSKYSYGYSRYALPLGLPLFDGRILASEPERGDVAVFKYPPRPSEDYIKRIIGLPGDRVRVLDGRLYVNGLVVSRDRVEDFVEGEGASALQWTAYRETLPDGRSYKIIEEMGDRSPSDNTEAFTVPEGHFFAMGDNRDNSIDSRVMSRVGFVPMENLVGRAEFIFFSTNGSARLWEFWAWPGAIRFSRIFDSIE